MPLSPTSQRFLDLLHERCNKPHKCYIELKQMQGENLIPTDIKPQFVFKDPFILRRKRDLISPFAEVILCQTCTCLTLVQRGQRYFFPLLNQVGDRQEQK